VLGRHEVYVEAGATVEPLVCLDATAGPILVRRRATIAAFTRLVGPCYVGEHSSVLGGRVAVAAIGEWCKVQGEVNTVVFHSFANKGHDGFVGHSLVGRWANLGAGTTTSNLKNTYGTVQLWTPDGVRDTGLQFAGTLFGDHVKSGIGTMLNTGTVLGAGANVFGGVMPSKMVPAFGWGAGAPYDHYDLSRFLRAAERAMARRAQPLTERARRQLSAAHALATASWPERA
jgi:UDP-N-acetylglucosamine diphosphorylase/glucosamine-1-phosphate N-acetyltransferase